MSSTNVTRRAVLDRSLQLPAAGVALWALSACGEGEQKIVCAGPNNLTFAENSLRQASHYVEEAPDPTKSCTQCSFFKPVDAGSICGPCEIFVGPVNARGHCDSFAVKPA